MTSIQIITLGCSKNVVDTEHLLGQLPSNFVIFNEEDSSSMPDYLLLNTCGFIGDAKEESIQAIFEAVRRKQEAGKGKVFVFGCLSQRYSGELPDLIPEVDGWFGARDISEVLRALGVSPKGSVSRYLSVPSKPYAYLKISEGCDRRCSYCAIPLIRGPHKSVPMETLVEEAAFLAGKGVKELILIAQDTTFYGLDLYGRRALAELIDKLSEVEGIEWIRIHYSYPADFPEDVLDRMADNPKVCKYLDIPLQHVSDSVLEAMRRHVDGAWTRELIKKLREKVPGVVLRTTMMVGHPGESEEAFEELLDFIADARFERLGAFRYSEEEGTYGAEHLPDSIAEEEKQRRYDSLMTLQADISLDFNAGRVGTSERVLVDDFVSGRLICRSQYESPDVDGEIIVVPKPGTEVQDVVGTFVNVRITGYDQYDLTAEIL